MRDTPSPTSMVVLPGGSFLMGTPERKIAHLQAAYDVAHPDLFTPEVPQHRVALAPFAMDIHPVTNAQFQAFLDVQPRWQPAHIALRLHNGDYLKHWDGLIYPAHLADHPVVYVCWYAAVAYAAWVNKRLPTEAEWEYAARGGQADAEFPWGTAAPDPGRANYGASQTGTTTPVCRYPPNPFGLYDLAGNVWEYCVDEWQAGYDQASPAAQPMASDPLVVAGDYLQVTTRRVIRGGSWGGMPVNLRLAYRDSHPPTGAGPHVGFRCVRSVSDSAAGT